MAETGGPMHVVRVSGIQPDLYSIAFEQLCVAAPNGLFFAFYLQ